MKTKWLISVGSVALLASTACSKESNEAAPVEAPAPKVVAATAAAGATVARDKVELQQVIDAHWAALGGTDAWRAAKSMTFTISGTKKGVAFSSKTSRKRPSMFRVDSKKGDKITIKAFDGKVASVSQDGKIKILKGDKAAGMASWAAFDDVLLTYKETGKKVSLKGTETVDGSLAYVLVIAGEGGDETRYIDAASHLEVKRVVAWKHEGKSGTKTMYFTDYRSVGGLMVNHGLIGEYDGVKNEMKVGDIGFDLPLDDAFFSLAAGDS